MAAAIDVEDFVSLDNCNWCEFSSLVKRNSSQIPESGGDEPVPEPVVKGESLK
jgi:hypothetical protein